MIEATAGRRREDALRLASWRLVGGGGSAELLVAGAIAARSRHDHSLAERMARAAIDEGAGFEAHLVAAEAAHFQGRSDQASLEAATLAAHTTNDAERARVALLRFDNAFFLQGRADFRVLDDAADAITDPFWLDELSAGRLNVMALSSGPRATVEAASTVLQRPRLGALTAPHLVVFSLVRLGRLDDAIQIVSPAAARRAIPAADDGWGQWTLFGDRAVALVYAGRLGEAEALLTSAYDQVVDQPAAEARATVMLWLAVLHLEQGRVQIAFRRAAESYTLYQELGRTLVARLGYIAAAQALAMAGQANKAAKTLAALDALDLPAVLLDHADLLQARAWTAAAAGDLPAARAQLEGAADLGEQVGDLVGAAGALHGLARLGQARHVAARLAALADEVDGALVTARAAYAAALAARNSTDLGKVACDFEDLGAVLYAAEASAEAAVSHRRAGERREAAAAEQRAGRLLARCEGAATPPVQTIMARARLTPSELDAAVQAAAGRSNKQIAADLYLSVRTVESHLQRVYEKLGISRRHELADALRDQPTDS
jgi:DNA-binding CsgD family transcriptional regulator